PLPPPANGPHMPPLLVEHPDLRRMGVRDPEPPQWIFDQSADLAEDVRTIPLHPADPVRLRVAPPLRRSPLPDPFGGIAYHECATRQGIDNHEIRRVTLISIATASGKQQRDHQEGCQRPMSSARPRKLTNQVCRWYRMHV